MTGSGIPAIVFGGGMNGVATVRNLGRYGIPVLSVVDNKDEVRHSRYCKKCYVVPQIQASVHVLKSFLQKIQRNLHEGAVLFSTTDFFSLHLSALKNYLEDNYYVPLPSYDIVKTLVCKKEFYHSLSKQSLPYPSTYIPESLDDVKQICRDATFPLLVKPSMSQSFYSRFHTKGFQANSEKELLRYYSMATKCNLEVIFQEIIPSEWGGLTTENMYGIEGYLAKKHDSSAFFAYHRLRGWPPLFGNTSLRESIPISEIRNQFVATEEYLNDLGFKGLMEAEWKKDPRDGTLKLLEINARQSMQNSLPTSCGVNLVLLAYLESIGEKINCINNYETGVRWADLVNDLRSATVTRTSIKDWICSLKPVKEWSFFASDDLAPWFSNNLRKLKEAVELAVNSRYERYNG